MQSAQWLGVLLVMFGATGCYLSHEAAPSGTFDAGSSFRDAGVRRRDAGNAGREVDAEVPLPRDPRVDPGPDARPSDDPEAAGWEDDPGLAPDAACCEPIGPPTDIRVGEIARGGLAIAWNGDGWGVLYSGASDSGGADGTTAFQALDRDGRPVGGLRRYEEWATGADLEWADGRFAVLVTSRGGGPQDTAIALLDRRGVIDAGWTNLELGGFGGRVARLAHRDRWVAVSSASGVPVDAVEIDARAQIVSRALVDPRTSERSAVVGLKSRVVVFFSAGATTIFARPLTTPIAESDSANVELIRHRGDEATMATARLRDRAVLIATHGGTNWGSFASLDPFTGEFDAREIALPPVVTWRFPHDAVGLDGPGLVAVCFGVRAGDPIEESWIELRVFRPNGEEAAGAVRVTDLSETIGVMPCAVGSDGERIFVAWQAERAGLVRVQGFRLRR